ncbi:hypothetical protein BDZ45DRAFT_736244 [Acephala macrosclerotiorum]|nr:hypothetical protein BDZ45DRAFT_736244 [Acephala macrosclerotiorum]
MVSCQAKIETLLPQQRKEQEEWAESEMEEGLAPCPRGGIWQRDHGGYRCAGRAHFISDELLAEGNGRLYEHGIHQSFFIHMLRRIRERRSVEINGKLWYGSFTIHLRLFLVTLRGLAVKEGLAGTGVLG